MKVKIDLENRNTIQIMRGIAILMVVLHHTLSLLDTWIGSATVVHIVDMMHVNIFFVISGYLFQKSSNKYKQIGFKAFLKKKIQELFIPYYLLSVIFALLIKLASVYEGARTVLISKGYYEKTLVDILVDPLIFNKPYFTSLWYVYVLLLYFIISWFLISEKIDLGQLILIGAIGITSNMFLWQYMPDVLYKFFRYYLFFTFGRWISCRFGTNVIIKKKILWIAVGILLLFIGRNIWMDLSGWTIMARNIETQAERTLTAFCGVILCSYISSVLATRRPSNLLKTVGDKSYVIYLLHNPWVICVVAIICQKLGMNLIVQFVIIMASGIAVPMMFDAAASRIKEVIGNDHKSELS